MTYHSPGTLRARERIRSHTPTEERIALYWMIAPEHGSRHSFTCAASTTLSSSSTDLAASCSSSAIRIDLLFLVNLDRLRIDDSPKEPTVLHLDRSSLKRKKIEKQKI
ncbi:hypothetical protein EAG_02108 [Camponotus floridanus]|uniref:Uncharacterized protein n=1 Tax=Camponotus floridanus TaxID=104421 RepID=E2B1P0_CAMFO|nr:hypothetical protein EAG_02108 [Camponotus floridanus]